MIKSKSYATAAELESGFRTLTDDEKAIATEKLYESAVLIDRLAPSCSDSEAKKIVSMNMVRRAIGDSDSAMFPTGSTQGSMSAMGYSQSWTVGGGGSVGELYLTKNEKRLLGIGGHIGFANAIGDCHD